MTVRSKQLAALEISDALAHTVYTVPTGYRTILKCVTIKSKAPAAQIVAVFAKSPSAIIIDWTYSLGASNSATDSKLDNTWVVLEAGQTLNVQCGSTGCYFSASGAELLL